MAAATRGAVNWPPHAGAGPVAGAGAADGPGATAVMVGPAWHVAVAATDIEQCRLHGEAAGDGAVGTLPVARELIELATSVLDDAPDGIGFVATLSSCEARKSKDFHKNVKI